MRFVFYNPHLATNDFSLLHSDMQGELQNSNWQDIIYNFNGSGTDINPATRIEDKDNAYGGNAGVLFKN